MIYSNLRHGICFPNIYKSRIKCVRTPLISLIILLTGIIAADGQVKTTVPDSVMRKVYEEILTPYKYGLVIVPADSTKMVDCPSIFRKDGKWHMTYLVFDGRGYETWLAESDNLLEWQTKGRILSFSSDTSNWDCNQKAGYIGLQDYNWGGSYELQQYREKYWMSYIGGEQKGYETVPLSIGIANTGKNPSTVHEWNRLDKPVLTSQDPYVRWWENVTLYKSNIIWDKSKTVGYPFVMYYNANGDSSGADRKIERIGMAVSNNMVEWKRLGKDPVLNHHKGITGDPQVQKMGDVWVMFYFGAFWPTGQSDGAFNNFACSYDLIHWTDWTGSKLLSPSEPYDNRYAHKSFVVQHSGIVYHFYCAVNQKRQRGIAVATSRDLGISKLNFTELSK